MQKNLTYVWIFIRFGEIEEDPEKKQLKRDKEWD